MSNERASTPEHKDAAIGRIGSDGGDFSELSELSGLFKLGV